MEPLTPSPEAVTVHGTEIRPDDTREIYRQKIARVTLDSMVQFVGLLDARGTVLEINKVALDAVGVKLSEVEGKPFWTTFWWQVSDDINATLRASIARAAKGEIVRWDTPIYGRAGGKETIIIDASLCPVADDQGNVVFIAAEGRDITEKKAQEAEIARKNVELQTLLARIRELDELKTQFFANVSHELRTPLALILGPAEKLIAGGSVIPDAERAALTNVIRRNASTLLKQVNDLLDIAKLDAGRMELDYAKADLSKVVRMIAGHFEALAPARQVQFTVEAPDHLAGEVDPEKIGRVLLNLLSNAFKFTPVGGKIHVTLAPLNGSRVRASVEDSGPGIPAHLREAIFERFRQGEGGANRKFGGTGLGLAIAKEFVELHHGTLSVGEASSGGASFSIVLPRKAPAGARVREQSEGPGSDVDAITAGTLDELKPRASDAAVRRATPADHPVVLVVEDNPEMNDFISDALSDVATVLRASDGREGLEKAAAGKPDLVVTDLMMPRMSGDEMARAIRGRAELRDIPILVLSARADDLLRNKLLKETVDDYVVKPFSADELRARATNLIRVKRTRQLLQAEIGEKKGDLEELARAVTIRKRELETAQQSLREMSAGLEERTGELEAALSHMEAFSYTVAHDLRAPLRAMSQLSSLLIDECSSKLGEQGTEYARRIGAAAVRMDGLTRDLLEFSRLARTDAPVGPLELRAVVEVALSYVEEEAGPFQAEVGEEIGRCVVTGNRTLLLQVLRNLLSNAVKFHRTGVDPRVRLRAETVAGGIRLWVEDNGIGMEPAHFGKLFKIFERLDPRGPFPGNGIGLASSKQAVEKMSGRIGAESEPGKGSRFWVELPGEIRA